MTAPSGQTKRARPRLLFAALCLVTALAIFFGGPALCAVRAHAISIYIMPPLDASDAKFKAAIKELRAEALASCGRKSFNGYCAWYVNLQLYLLDINRDYIAGDGNDEFNNYRGLRYTSGGYRVHAYPEDEYTLKSALNAIIKAADGRPVRNVLAGFSKAGGSGEKYGHTFFIHLIRDGYVFFSDSFGVTIGGTYYPEGEAIKCTVDELFAFYKPSSFVLDGVIWFDDENETPLPPASTSVVSPSVCRIVADGGLRVRSGPGTGYDRLALIPDGSTIWVTEISEDGLWGRVYYDGHDGWSSLEYMEPAAESELPAVICDIYEGGVHTSRSGADSPARAASEATAQISSANGPSTEVRLLLTRTPADAEKVTLTGGVTLDCASFGTGAMTLLLEGGEVVSDAALPALDADPFVSSELSGGRRIYTSTLEISMRSASLIVSDRVSLRFGASVNDSTGLPEGTITYSLIYTVGEDGDAAECPLLASSADGYIYFATDGMSAKQMADTVRGCVRATMTLDGKVYEKRSEKISYSVTRYAANMYGRGEGDSASRFDRLLGAMLGYGSAAQSYFGYNTDNSAILALPEEGMTPPEYAEDELFRRAEAAPVVNYSSTAHITSASLELKDAVGIRMRATGLEEGSAYCLLVWSHAEYTALAASGGNIDELMTLGNCQTVLSGTDGVFVLDGIPAKKLADTYYFRLCEIGGDGTVKYDRVLSYSVTTYCANKASGSDSLAALCRAIATYSAAAREYFGYTVNEG